MGAPKEGIWPGRDRVYWDALPPSISLSQPQDHDPSNVGTLRRKRTEHAWMYGPTPKDRGRHYAVDAANFLMDVIFPGD